MEKRPWLDYTGQTTAELLACKTTHRIDSLLCAFESGIQRKPEGGITEEENLVLAIEALQREVNNGGYHQFFANSSGRFAPVIVDCLRRIGCETTAAITERAVAIGVTVAGSVELLDACDREFYKLTEIEPALFRFIEENQDRIQLVKADVPPPRQLPVLAIASTLRIHLSLAKLADRSMDGIRGAARDIAAKTSMSATDADIEAASVLAAFSFAVDAGTLAEAELLAPRAFDLMRDDTMHCVIHRKWAQKLIEATKPELADAATLFYLEYLATCDQSTLSTQNRILFWAQLLQQHRAILPKSVAFCTASFPEEDLNQKLPRQRFEPRPVF
jgi:hypothetical protein